MPQSNSCQRGGGPETTDAAGSCDSVVSVNSSSSDDSLEFLSAEEKACLMFLEETIESLDVEESELSSDELPNPGNLATKLADLSACLNKKQQGLQDGPRTESIKRNLESKALYSYLVPTPFVVANSAHRSVANANTSKPRVTFKDHKPGAPPVPLEVNVVTVPPIKANDCSGRTTDGLLPRGPLSYDALVHLRKSASVKKTPLCPTVDHTIDLDHHSPLKVRGPNVGNLSTSEPSKSKINPPAVPPKPKIHPVNIPKKTLTGSTPSNSFYNVKNAQDPKWARLEALQKLGLLKDDQPANDITTPLPPNNCHSSLSSTSNKCTRGPSNCTPSRSPSFYHSRAPTETKNRALQSSASFHCYSRNDQQPAMMSNPVQPNRSRNDQQPAMMSNPVQPNRSRNVGMERSATVVDQRSRSYFAEQSQITSAKTVQTRATAQSSSSLVGYTAMVVPGMGADRKEALRKLGLLKN